MCSWSPAQDDSGSEEDVADAGELEGDGSDFELEKPKKKQATPKKKKTPAKKKKTPAKKASSGTPARASGRAAKSIRYANDSGKPSIMLSTVKWGGGQQAKTHYNFKVFHSKSIIIIRISDIIFKNIIFLFNGHKYLPHKLQNKYFFWRNIFL